MDNDMNEDLEKYEEEYAELRKEATKAMIEKASKEEIDIIRKKMFNVLFKIEVLKSEIENINEEKDGKRL